MIGQHVIKCTAICAEQNHGGYCKAPWNLGRKISGKRELIAIGLCFGACKINEAHQTKIINYKGSVGPNQQSVHLSASNGSLSNWVPAPSSTTMAPPGGTATTSVVGSRTDVQACAPNRQARGPPCQARGDEKVCPPPCWTLQGCEPLHPENMPLTRCQVPFRGQ